MWYAKAKLESINLVDYEQAKCDHLTRVKYPVDNLEKFLESQVFFSSKKHPKTIWSKMYNFSYATY